MVTARLVSAPMSFNEEEIGILSSHDRLDANPGPADEGAVGQVYRSLARTYAGKFTDTSCGAGGSLQGSWR
jgi:hypothetical protein